MHFAQLVNRLYLKNQTIFDQNIDPEGRIEMLPIQREWYGNLSGDPQPARFEPSKQDGFVDRLK